MKKSALKKLPVSLVAGFAISANSLHAASTLIDWGGTGMATADNNFTLPTPTDNGTTRTWEYSATTPILASGGTYAGPSIYGALQTTNATDGPTNFSNLLVDDRGANTDFITTLLNGPTNGDIVQGLVFFRRADFENFSAGPAISFDSNSSATLNVSGNQGAGSGRGPRIAVLNGTTWYVSSSLYQGFSGTFSISNLSTENFAVYDPTGAPLDPTPGSFNVAGSTFTDIQGVGYYFFNGTTTSGQAGFSISGFNISGLAIPEPSSMALLALGVFALAGRRRRRCK